MPFAPCEFEIIPPDTEPIHLDDAALQHPDTEVAARMRTFARAVRSRRFALCQAVSTREQRPAVFPVFQGFANPDGSCVILQDGRPRGWYASIASAWKRLRRTQDLWLVWLEPPVSFPAFAAARAELSAVHDEPATWFVSVPFTAFGDEDARQTAIDTANHLAETLPGMNRSAVLYAPADSATPEAHAFCTRPDCLLAPRHKDAHQPDDESSTPDTSTDDPHD
jgi:hypothetical protein